MPQILQHRRGTTAELSTERGSIGEFWMDETKNTVVVMDGSTLGGHPLAKQSEIPTIPTNVSEFVNDAGYITVANTFSKSYNELIDVPTSFTPNTHTQDWSTITNTPTTVAGYGITDIQFFNQNVNTTDTVEFLSVSAATITANSITIDTGGLLNLQNSSITGVDQLGAVSVNAISLNGSVYGANNVLLVDAANNKIVAAIEAPSIVSASYIDAATGVNASGFGSSTIGSFINLGVNASSVNVVTDIDMLTNDISNATNISANTVTADFVGNLYSANTVLSEGRPLINSETKTVEAIGVAASVIYSSYGGPNLQILTDVTNYPTGGFMDIRSQGTNSFMRLHSANTTTIQSSTVLISANTVDLQSDVVLDANTTFDFNGATISGLAYSNISGTPTTLSGYGITDAATSAQGALADTAVQPGNNGGVVYQYGYSAHDAVSLTDGDFTVNGNTMIVSLTTSNNAQGVRIDISGHTTGGSAGVGLIYISRRINGGSWLTWNAFSVNGADYHFSHSFVDFYDVFGSSFDVSPGDTVEYKLTNGTTNTNFVSYNAAAVDFELFWGFNFTATEVPLSYSLIQP